MKFTDFSEVNKWFNANENEKNHINYMKSHSKVWNGNFEPKDAAMWLITVRLNLGIKTQELAVNYIDEIECGIFNNFSQITRDFNELKKSNPNLF